MTAIDPLQTSHQTRVSELGDAATLLLAEASGNYEPAALVLDELASNVDAAGAVRLLQRVLDVAGVALAEELLRAHESDDRTPPLSFQYLASLQKYARTDASSTGSDSTEH